MKEEHIFSKYKLLLYASHLSGKHSYWPALPRILTVPRESNIPALVKCPDGVLDHLLRVRECKGKVIENSFLCLPLAIIKQASRGPTVDWEVLLFPSDKVRGRSWKQEAWVMDQERPVEPHQLPMICGIPLFSLHSLSSMHKEAL